MPERSSGPAAEAAGRAGTRIAEAIFDFVGQVPETDEPAHRDPAGRARRIGNATAARAALSAGGLALPPGPLGWLTILPELRTVWKQQARMVADIAGAYGRTGDLPGDDDLLPVPARRAGSVPLGGAPPRRPVQRPARRKSCTASR